MSGAIFFVIAPPAPPGEIKNQFSLKTIFISLKRGVNMIRNRGVSLFRNQGVNIVRNLHRNPSTSKKSLGEALKNGYSVLYAKDESCHKLDKTKLKGLMMEITGESHSSGTLNFMVNTFWNAKELADFKNLTETEKNEEQVAETVNPEINNGNGNGVEEKIKLGLNYTINLVLPKTDDPAIYNAIFKSLRENLLK